MANNSIALMGQSPNINALGAFQEGQAHAAGMDRAKMANAEKTMQIIGSAAMYALNGNPDGQADPAKYAEVMEGLQSMGMDVSKFRDNPSFANVAAKASLTAMQQMQLAQNEREFEASLEQFDRTFDLNTQKLTLAQQEASRVSPSSPLGKLNADFQAGLIDKPTYDAAVAKATAPSKGITVNNLSATDRKAVLEADEGIEAAESVISALDQAIELNDQAFEGFGADTRAALGAKLPDAMIPDFVADPAGSQATIQLDNLIKSQALDQLKSTFGAMPTEGERKILLEIQGSSDQPAPVRRKIYERAKAMAQKRLAFNRQRAEALRSGEYYQPQGGGSSDPVDNGDGAPEITTREEYESLPSGSEFIWNGEIGIKP